MEIDEDEFNNLKRTLEGQGFRISDLEDAIYGLREEISELNSRLAHIEEN